MFLLLLIDLLSSFYLRVGLCVGIVPLVGFLGLYIVY